IFSCDAPVSAEPGEAGTRRIAEHDGLEALTHFRVIERSGDGTALLEAVPVTGRTNQIRLHLHHLGHPVVGDPAYTSAPCGIQTLDPCAPPLCLHAWKLTLSHPLGGHEMTFEADCIDSERFA
ncbi:MAG TPA: pseudouridine synthase, partial [Luteolibacter sp.]|nr:pseudouridine synthase [Luteolibacter sp.]